jgi:hypothetical protein
MGICPGLSRSGRKGLRLELVAGASLFTEIPRAVAFSETRRGKSAERSKF